MKNSRAPTVLFILFLFGTDQQEYATQFFLLESISHQIVCVFCASNHLPNLKYQFSNLNSKNCDFYHNRSSCIYSSSLYFSLPLTFSMQSFYERIILFNVKVFSMRNGKLLLAQWKCIFAIRIYFFCSSDLMWMTKSIEMHGQLFLWWFLLKNIGMADVKHCNCMEEENWFTIDIKQMVLIVTEF